MNDKAKTITADEALGLLPDGEDIHVFMGGGMALVGADWRREQVEKAIRDAERIDLTGSMARSMKHGIAVDGLYFIATDTAKIDAFDPLGA